jgi:hypothetical protein
MWTNTYDPVMTCQPLGVRVKARRGASTNRSGCHLIYQGGVRRRIRQYRVIDRQPPAHERGGFDITYFGNAVGRWEGDTLVVDSIAFIDTTWLGRGGCSTPTGCMSSRSSRVRAMLLPT